MNKVRLKFKWATEILGTENIGLLILTDELEQRQLTVPCDRNMMYQFSVRMSHLPIADRMIPEVLWEVISTQTDLKFEIFINDLIDGQYRAMLYNTETLVPIAMRASDAVLLAFISKTIPLYIEEGLFRRQSVEYHKEATGVSIPLNTISDEMLQNALQKAVEEEKYELASHLRDEINRRKNNKG
ncbi:MAG: DUF151 domain-containing protein [Prevotella sp.]|jgi:bifunctional DNase/RNase|nr:DUF151 domain-containing protein [Prevotella sp.]MCI2080922.1 DUF151 domain-containing protein [Prevotella sp.]MCI2102804.1 DUF151 domain-containing protein [Prevotella sp.]HCN54729.1 bifunctional nuclease [Prevotella sp.]